MGYLINHCGAKRISSGELAELADPKPYTDTHYPIRHDVFVSLAKDSLAEGGYEIASEEYSLLQRSNADNLFGVLTLKADLDDVAPLVGLRNSGSMDFLAELGAGEGVTVCDNQVFTAQIIVGRKHTRHIMRDLPKQMTTAVDRLKEEFRRQEHRRSLYKNTNLSDEEAHDVMIKTMALPKPQGIPCSKMNAWLREFREPSHPEFENNTAWALQNAFTEIAKAWNFAAMQKRTAGLVQVMDQALDFENWCAYKELHRT